MVLLKQLLAFPLYGTVAWLVWVLIQEVGPDERADGLVRACAGRVRGVGLRHAPASPRAGDAPRRDRARRGWERPPRSCSRSPQRLPGARPEQTASADGLPYERVQPGAPRRADRRARPVFVNLTAAWCITCLVNEHATLDTAAVRQAFAEHGSSR